MDIFSQVESDENSIRLDSEALLRLLKKIASTLGTSPVWSRGLEQQITTLQRGFKLIARQYPAAAYWHQALCDLLSTKPAPVSFELGQTLRLSALLQRQPILMPRNESESCLGLAALAFAAQVSGTHVSQKYLDGLEQLFSSSRIHWQRARQLLADRALSASYLSTPLPEVVTNFLGATSQLRAGGVFFPNYLNSQSQPDLPHFVPNCAHGESHAPVGSALIKAKKTSVFQVEACEQLFEFQVVQQEQETALNNYLLNIDWNSQTDAEFRDASRILVSQLNTPENSSRSSMLRLHAACRLISELAQLSIEKLASMPLYRRGSMHLDLKCGLMRRDLAIVAPRADRTKGPRWLRRWLRTPIPPEVLSVLRKVAAIYPESRTVGDLMVGAGLTPSECHRLMNQGRLENRVHESLRVARSLRSFLLAQGVHASTVSRVLGDISILPNSHHYYLALDQKAVYGAINLWCQTIGLTEVNLPSRGTLIGSPKVPTFDQMARSFQLLQDENHNDRKFITARSCLDDVIQFHNNFVSRYVLQLLWAEGARCQKLSSITVGTLFPDNKHIVLSDRDSDRYAQRRVCPLSSALQQSRLNYVTHLCAMVRWTETRGELEAARSLERIIDGRDLCVVALPILFRNRKTTLTSRPITRADLNRVKTSTSIGDLNEPRHFLISELDRREIESIAISAQVGHHHTSAPAFGVGSGMSISDFSTYMTSVLEQLHIDLGLQPLTGLGTTAIVRLKLPWLSLPDVLPPPNNLYLTQRLAVEDFNPPDIFLAEEDCPVSDLTLPCRSNLLKLRAAYLKSDVLGRHPWGAVLFCLIGFDLVLNISDLEQFFNRLKTKSEVNIKKLSIVEIFDQGPLPIGQCLLSEFSVAVLKVARAKSSHVTFGEALNDLNEMLLSLDPIWPKIGVGEAAQRLQSMAAHLSMVDLPGVSRFSLIHKSPFVPGSDIQRIVFGHMTQIDLPRLQSRPVKRSSDFKEQMVIVARWADKDAPLGEYQRRANGLLDDLARLESNYLIDEVDLMIHDFIRAELSEHPPYRKLKLNVFEAYLKVQIQFFAQTRILGDLPRTPEEWISFMDIFVDADDAIEGRRRWAGFHLGAWLMTKGYSVPQLLVRDNKHKVNYKPHLSAYVTYGEIEQCIEQLQYSGLGFPLKEWLPIQLRLQRRCVLRPAESRFLQAGHVSQNANHIHITTSGHNHLKNQYARGLVSVPESLRYDLLVHKERRRGSPEGLSASLFVPAGEDGYIEYDQCCKAARLELQCITGRGDLRLYDFRACAITDILLDIQGSLKSLVHGNRIYAPKVDGNQIAFSYSRGAAASREARQSNVVTTLRYYYLGGAIENRVRLNALQQDVKPSASYLAIVQGKSSAAVLVQRHRLAQGAIARTSCPCAPLPEINSSLDRSAKLASRTAQPQLPPGDRLVLAGLLTLGGLDPTSAADAASMASDRLDSLLPELMAALAEVGITSLHHTAAQSSSIWFPMLAKISSWAYLHRHAMFAFTNRSPKAFRLHGSKLSFSSHAAVISLRELWVGLPAIGFQPLLIYSNSVVPSQRAANKAELLRLGIRVAPFAIDRQRFAAMRFCPCISASTPERDAQTAYSNHQMGKSGRLVVAAMTLAISIATLDHL